MNIPILLEDLIKNFHDGKASNESIIGKMETLINQNESSFAHRFFQTGLSLFLELLLWIGLVACIGAIIFMENLYPFSFLSSIGQQIPIDSIQQHQLTALIWVTRGIFLLLGISFLWTARIFARNRTKAKLLRELTKALKGLMEQLLQRRSALQTLSVKYPVDLEGTADENAPTLPSPKSPPENREKGHDDILL